MSKSHFVPTPPDSGPRRQGGGQDGAVLGCVALPIVADDISQALPELFALWADARFLPVPDPDMAHPHLMVVVNRASDDQLARIETLFHRHPALVAAFSGVSAHSADLEGDRDIYAREGSSEMGRLGRKSGPNFLFQTLIDLATPHGGFVLQIELDCLPVQAGWVGATQAVIAAHPRAWVIGSHYAGWGMVGDDNKTHLNGNALYRVGDSGFRAFFADIWMPRLAHQIKDRPDLAYDCWWAVEGFRADARTGNSSWQLFQTYDGFFGRDPYVVNLLASQQGAQEYTRIFDRFSRLGRVPVFFHGPDMHAVRQMLLRYPGDSIFGAIDRIDPPEGPVAAPVRDPGPPARADAPQDGPLMPLVDDRVAANHLLLLAAGDLMAGDQDKAQGWLDPECASGQAIAAARALLGENHPACTHFDRVRAHADRH